MKFTHKRDIGEANARLCEKARLAFISASPRYFDVRDLRVF